MTENEGKVLATASLGKTGYVVREFQPNIVQLIRTDGDGRSFHVAYMPRALFDTYASDRAGQIIGEAVRKLFT